MSYLSTTGVNNSEDSARLTSVSLIQYKFSSCLKYYHANFGKTLCI